MEYERKKVFGYYHLKKGYQNRKNRVIVCSILEDNHEAGYWIIVARGIAICGFQDMPCKKIGRLISDGRAEKALRIAIERKDYDFGYAEVKREEAYAVIEDLESIGDITMMGHFRWKGEVIPEDVLPHEERELRYLNGDDAKKVVSG